MINMIMEAEKQIEKIIGNAYEKAVHDNSLVYVEDVCVNVEIPKDTCNGDFSSTFALTSAKKVKKSPLNIAKIIVERIELKESFFESVEIAGPGFINFHLGKKWFEEVLDVIECEGGDYGSNDSGCGLKIMVEFVSANPTGPMHIGNARGGVLGDTLANVFLKNGYDVEKEFYVNDAGNQIHKFAVSINARYMQLICGEDKYLFPEDGYHGDDIRELAQAVYEEYGDTLVEMDEDNRLNIMAEFGLKINIPLMKKDLKAYRIEYDNWFLESSLHDSGYIKETIEMLTEKGLTYESEGALWLNTTKLLVEKYIREGKSQEQIDKLNLKDDVLRRANGFYTYFAADIAYHRNKFEVRKFDKVINVWGADHYGHVARLQAALDGLGLDGSTKLVIVLMNLVNLLKDGAPVRMSKRSGKAIALRDLLDEISVDAARYFFNSRSASSAIDFDLDLAVKTDSDNPVYYIQYAYARICSLFANLLPDSKELSDKFKNVDTSMLSSDSEIELIKALAQYPEILRISVDEYDPSHINRYLLSLAGSFHRFYTSNRIKGEKDDVMKARMKLAYATRVVLKNGMDILGLTALEKM